MTDDVWADTQSGSPALLARSPLHAAKVMLVDDDPLMTDLIRVYLEDDGYSNFVVTNDPLEAMALLRSEEPSVLLLDLMMPQLSGFELMEQIRSDRQLRYMPVIVLTAASGSDAKLRALQLGATDFLSKPVDESELVLRLRNTLAYHQYHSRMVDFDAVTGLPQQRLFERGIDEAILGRQMPDGYMALFSITVPDCRHVRETVNKEAGDAFDREMARRLVRLVASEDPTFDTLAASGERAPRIARLGAERFGVLMDRLPSVEAIEETAKRIVEVLREPLNIEGHDLVPNIWMGISVFPGDGSDAESLSKGADLASTHARREGGVLYEFASKQLNARFYERMAMGSQLRNAAKRGELRLHYQPKVHVASGRIVGAEALVRWEHPERGLLAPGTFIPLAEEIGVIGSIGQWVIRRACEDAAGWLQAGFADVKVAINVAKPQFVRPELFELLRDATTYCGLPPSLVVIELTESMLMDGVDNSLAVMNDLKSLGLSLSIDDFGTGYSSLSYLKRFPLDELKIDKSFVDELPQTASDVAIVKAVIDLGHSLGMSVIAEGVETAAQLASLRQLDCDAYQGYEFSPPISLERFLDLLHSRNEPL